MGYLRYPTGEEILAIHARIIDATGGIHGVLDKSLLASLIKKPQLSLAGKEQFPGIWVKAAVYLDSFARYQVFADGNKRTGAAAASRFLYINGRRFHPSNNLVRDYVLKVASKRKSIKNIARWIRQHSAVHGDI